MELTSPLSYGVPIYVIMVLTEMFISYRKNKGLYYWKDTLASAAMGAGSVVLKLAFLNAAVVGIFVTLFEVFEPLRMQLFGVPHLGWAWYVWIIAVFADDFNFYWHHRFMHSVRFLWAAHVVHHSSRHFNFGTGLRNGWTTLMFKPIYWLWMPIVGFHPLIIASALALNSAYQFLLHTKTIPKIKGIDWLINTPFRHQVHHACNIEYLDKNHGGLFIIWDRMFGTFKENEEHELAPKFGVLHEPNSYNPLIVFSHEYRDIWNDMKKSPKLKHKFMYCFGPPGWSHDGSSMTTKQLQRKFAELQAQGLSREECYKQLMPDEAHPRPLTPPTGQPAVAMA